MFVNPRVYLHYNFSKEVRDFAANGGSGHFPGEKKRVRARYIKKGPAS
jgi:hypothetical protein